MTAIVLGVDSSTQSTKVQFRRIDDGAVVASGSASHPLTTPPRSEQDPQAWWDALVCAIESASGPVDDVVALSFAGQQHGMVLIGEDGYPTRPAKLWNDTESAKQAAQLVDMFGATELVRRTGSVPGAAFTLTKLAWMHENEPETLQRSQKVMLPHDYLTFRATGEHVTDRGDASGSGWWSADHGVHDDLLAAAGAGHLAVPSVIGANTAAGVTNVAIGQLPAGIIVAPGTGDNTAAALGLGLESGDSAVSLGTSGTVYARSDQQTHDESGAVAGFCDANGGFLPLVCTMNATQVTETVRSLLDVSFAELEALALRAGPSELTLVPYLDGERTPNRPLAAGSLLGLRTTTTRADLARASYEAVLFGLRAGLDALVAQGARCDGSVYLIGGGARSLAYQRFASEVFCRTIIVPDEDQLAAAGACVQAAMIASNSDAETLASQWGLRKGRTITAAEAADEVRWLRYERLAEATKSWAELGEC